MITISLTQLRRNLNKYLELSTKEDILVTSYGKPFSLLTKPHKDKYDKFLSCCCVIKDFDYKKLLEERDLSR